MSTHHGRNGQDEQERHEQDQSTGARPEEILREGTDQDAISDEEAVLAYNANAEDGDPEPETPGKE